VIRLTQRQINHGAFGLLVAVTLATLVNGLIPAPQLSVLVPAGGGLAICGGLWFAYWRGWQIARQVSIVLLTILVAIGMPDASLQRDTFSQTIFVVPALALVLTSSGWVLGSALVLLVVFAYRTGGGAYADPAQLFLFAFIIGGMVFSRLSVDNAYRLEAAIREADESRTRAEQRERELAIQAVDLTERNADQARLLELVATLETPTIVLAEGVLLAPIVGALDSRRAQTLTARLLNEAGTQRARQVILDISGVTTVDTQVAQALVQTARALGLLGCQVMLTGVSASVAITLTQLGVNLEGMVTMRSPQEALT
jgi:rsbT co-antagonist protein RsbR